MIVSPAARLQEVSEYYFAKKLRELRERMNKGEDIINLGIGNPDMAPSDDTVKALINSAVEPHHHGYQPYKGIPALRNGFANWYLNTYGVTLDPEQEILPLIGSKEGIMHISMAFLNPGDQVLVPNPGYPTYTSVTRLVEAEPVFYALTEENGWKPDLEALAAQDLSKVKLMWINYPHMPTGTNASLADLEELVAFAQKHQILLCHDNPYSLVLNKEPRSIFSVPGAWEVAIELNSLSKSHNMAGWRIGMVAGAQPYVDTVMRVKSNMDSGMFLPMQEAAAAALNNSYEWHRARNEEYAERKVIACQLLDTLGCSYATDQAGMFVWASTPDGTDGFAFTDAVLDETLVFLTPGGIFGSEGNNYVRISLCTPKHRLQEALERIRERQLTSV
ncbi:MAG: aminotransferase class I/II-fold pyridoxal phosphate-dependent enzyme [Bacteroidia bacterium]|nr:aminotransferase class I/II-fold pyridoxal phosphate-dependent enzyme [Bacteroidia bacterium]